MIGLGTIINVGCIVAGGLVGSFAGKHLKENIQETVMNMTGVGVIVLGMGGALAKMLTISDGKLTTGHTIMMVVCLALGAIIGEALQLEEKIIRFGEWLKIKSNSGNDSRFVNGFVTASCTVCIGAMAVIGSIQDGVTGDYSTLAVKGIIDAIIICIMTVSQGKGCIFSAIPVGIVQGLITVAAFFIGDFIPAPSLEYLSFVGSILIMCIGMNLVRDKQIRVANALPAIIIAIAWGFVA